MHHPDAPGGSHEFFVKAQRCWDILANNFRGAWNGAPVPPPALSASSSSSSAVVPSSSALVPSPPEQLSDLARGMHDVLCTCSLCIPLLNACARCRACHWPSSSSAARSASSSSSSSSPLRSAGATATTPGLSSRWRSSANQSGGLPNLGLVDLLSTSSLGPLSCRPTSFSLSVHCTEALFEPKWIRMYDDDENDDDDVDNDGWHTL